MKKMILGAVLMMAGIGLFAGPAYAPLVNVVEEPAEEEETAPVDSDTVDFREVEDADSTPTWSPSFENQDENGKK
jgi:hypothetical protein